MKKATGISLLTASILAFVPVSADPPVVTKVEPSQGYVDEDQLFVTAFVRSHGSIKEMESLFGISYPTVKNRLNAISAQLPFVDINPPSPGKDVLDQLDKGEISVEEALSRLKG